MTDTAQIHYEAANESGPRSAAIRVVEIAYLRLNQRQKFLQSERASDTPLDEALWHEVNSGSEISSLQQELDEQTGSHRNRLINIFALTQAEIALLDLAVAVGVDSALEESVASAQGHPWRPVPIESLVKRLYEINPDPIWHPGSPLAQWRLVCPVPQNSGASHGFKADPAIIDWYFGRTSLGESLQGCCVPAGIYVPLSNWAPEAHAENIEALLSRDKIVRVNLLGEIGSGRRDYASTICAALGKPALIIDGSAIPEIDFLETYIRIQRLCILIDYIPVWDGIPKALWPNSIPATQLQFILTSKNDRLEAARNSIDLIIEQPELTPKVREEIWAEYCSEPFETMPQSLKTCSLKNLQTSLALKGVDMDDISNIQNQHMRSELETLGRVFEPAVDWDDLILTPTLIADLKGLSYEARTRDIVLSPAEAFRIYKRDAGLSAMFYGPPGVGKTLAAQCIASDLDVPLLVIDVSRTVSKYIGETAKNLSRIFEIAKASGCVLFFDEADAYFSKRTELKDSHDKYTNADTNHLLQLLESYEGVLILATNKRSNIDSAFFRRLRHCISFRNPDIAERKLLWARFTQTLFSSKELQNHIATLDKCAARFEITPAQIKASVLNAKYAALKNHGELSELHFWQGIARELRKEGRSLPTNLQIAIEGVQHVT